MIDPILENKNSSNSEGNFDDLVKEFMLTPPKSKVLLSFFIHEIRNHLHSVSGISNYLESFWQTATEENKIECFKTIHKKCNSITEILEIFSDLVNSDHREALNFEQIDIIKLSKNIVKTCNNANINKKHIKIKFKSNVNNLNIKIQKIWFHQLLENLIYNSLKYSNDGTIDVIINEEILDGVNNAIISIKDQGIGILEEDLDHVFDFFKRGSDKKIDNIDGQGLGLAMSKKIVSYHGGNIAVSNNHDKGITVKFNIPVNI